MNKRIKELRKELKLTQQSFADALNISKSTVEAYEYRNVTVTDRTIQDICRIYHVNELWLRTGEGSMFQERTREIEIAEMTAAMYKADENDFQYQLMKLIAQLTPEQVHMLREIVEQLHDGINGGE